MWLKPSTPQNIVIGGAAGAFPPMIGWAAATGTIGSRIGRDVPDHLRVDAAAFLGARHAARRRICARRRADAAGGRGRARDAPPDPALFDPARAGRRAALPARLCRRCSTARSRSLAGILFVAAPLASAQGAEGEATERAAKACSAIPSSISCCCSPCCWSIRASAGRSGDCVVSAVTIRHDAGRHRAYAGTEARAPPALGCARGLARHSGRAVLCRDAGEGPRRPQPAALTMAAHRTAPSRKRDAVVAAACGAFVALMVGRVLCLGAALRLVLPRHRLQRHHAGRESRARPDARPHGHRALRRQCRRRPAVEIHAGEEPDRGAARRRGHGRLHRHQSGGARDATASPPTMSRRSISAPISRRSTASASPIRP